MSRAILALLVGLLAATRPVAQEVTSNNAILNHDLTTAVSITASGADCTTATRCTVLTLDGQNTVGIVITSIGGGATIQFESSVDGTNFVVQPVVPMSTTTGIAATVTSTTAVGTWKAEVAGMTTFRLRASALTSGTVTGALKQTAMIGQINVTQGLGKLNSANAWMVQITDNSGTNPASIVGANLGVTPRDSLNNNLGVAGNAFATVFDPTTSANEALSSSTKATVTTSVNVKASAGNVYGFSVLNGAGAGCFMELINSATAGTLGTAVIFNIALPTSGTLTLVSPIALGNFAAGIAVGVASAVGGASGCGTAATGITIFYK